MKKFYTITLLSLFMTFVCQRIYANPGDSCLNPIQIGTPGSVSSCTNYNTSSINGPLALSINCTSQGNFPSLGPVTWFKFCTNANANCISFTFNGINTGSIEMTIYSDCFTILNPNGSNNNSCFANGSGQFSTRPYNLSPSTCYYLRVRSASAGIINLCSQAIIPGSNDACSGAILLTSSATSANNYCYTYDASEPPPSSFCAGSGENSAWFLFTPQCTGSVTLNISNISCSGVANRIQIGVYTGSCGNLTNIGCTNFSGTTMPPLTISGLTAGQNVYLLIDGDLGALCSWNISATNTIPTITPVQNICRGQNVTLTATGGTSYLWSPGGATTPSITVSPASTTNYTCVVGNCTSTTLQTTVTVNTPIVPQFNQIDTICTGTGFNLPSTSINGISGSWSPAINTSATTTYTFTPGSGQCGTTQTMTVVVKQLIIPVFAQIAPVCAGEIFSLPTTSNNGISGSWSPVINTGTTTTYTFIPNSGQCASATSMTVIVVQPTVPQFNQIDTVCAGTVFNLPAISNNGISGSWSPAINSNISTTYTFTPAAGQCALPVTMTVIVRQPVIPQFTAISAICARGPVSLPLVSNNGIAGSWSPQINDTVTTIYTFTPASGYCATNNNMTVVINQPVIPEFNQIDTVCSGTVFNLPVTSTNGITGSWSPAINNMVTTTYVFTPSAGQCATTTTMTVAVKSPAVPLFTQQTPICAGSQLTLPAISNNGITGSWSPAVNNQSTTTYSFSPVSNSCVTSASMTVIVKTATTSETTMNLCNNQIPYQWNGLVFNGSGTQMAILINSAGCDSLATLHLFVNSYSSSTTNVNICSSQPVYYWNGQNYTTSGTYSVNLTGSTGCDSIAILNLNINQPRNPVFTAIGPVCSGTSFSLPTTSMNGITGSWSPAIDNNHTTTYTFTPDADQCAVAATLTVAVTSSIMPSFTPMDTICSGAVFSLPTTSNNGITGSWSPAINNLATTTYTFTPDPNQCATSFSITVVVKRHITPTFSAIAPICVGGNFTLQPVSNNGITGVWSPAMNNQISTTYTFTPNQGQCANTKTLSVIVRPFITPAFTQIDTICSGGIINLPVVSNNQITGYWTPPVNNTATTTYTFTPTSGDCAIPVDMTVVVNQPAVPVFNPIDTVCSGSPFVLPSISNNGISGNWSPAINNYATTTYTFTPLPGQCALVTTLTVVVKQPDIPYFTPIDTICAGTNFVLPSVSINGITGTWSPAINNTETTSYTFTPSPGQCANSVSMTVVIKQPVMPSFNQQSPVCAGTNFSLPLMSNNNISGSWSPLPDNNNTTTYTFTPASEFCALTVSMSVIVNQITNSTTELTVCYNQIPFTWNGLVFNGPGTQTARLTNANGCDSFATLHLIVNSFASSTTVVSLCNPQQPYVWNGTNYTVSGIYSVTLTGSSGCDSIAILNLSMQQMQTPVFAPVAPICAGSAFTLPAISLNGITGSWSPSFDNSTTTTYVFTPDAGQCADTTSMTVEVNTSFTTILIQSICQGEDYELPWGGTASVPGIYNHFYQTANGCDSIVNISLNINPVYTVNLNAVTCEGTPFELPWGRSVFVAGAYSHTYSSVHGCDSIVNITLSVMPVFNTTLSASVCSGSNYVLPWGATASSTGTYTHHYSSLNGCDSIVTISLTVNQPSYHAETQEACNSYLWNGINYTSSGTYIHHYNNTSGCSSADTLHLIVHQGTHNAETQTSCLSYEWHSVTYTTSGTYLYTYNNVNGCPSTDTLYLTIITGSHNTEIHTACENYSWHGVTHTTSGVYHFYYTNSRGCPSVDTLYLTINNGTHNIEYHIACESYEWHGTIYSSSGVFTHQYTNVNGCLSADTLHLTINHGTHNSEYHTTCESFSWHGTDYVNSGNYIYQYINTDGCPSADTLHLTVIHGSHHTEYHTACESYAWNGMVYSTSGVYTYQYNNTNGCLSADTLYLTINHGTHESEFQTACESYIWHGNTYTASGIYLYAYHNGNDCASVDTLHLTINHASSSFIPINVCSSMLPYAWNGQQYYTAGNYTVHFVNVNGCDSSATLQLSIIQVPAAPQVGSVIAVCQFEPSVALTASGLYPLLWYDHASGGTGSNTPPITSTSIPGVFHYYVSQINSNCESQRSIITVRVVAKPDLGPDKGFNICFGNELNLQSLYNTSNLQSQWLYNNNPVSNITNVNMSGNYQLAVSNANGCKDTVEISVTMLPQVTANAGPDVNAVYHEPVQLQGGGGSHYLWSPAIDLNNAAYSNPVATLSESTQFVLTVSDDYGCSDKDTVNISVFNEADIYMPNAFTPNGDGLNDNIKPVFAGMSKFEFFAVYNRFGNLIFETHDIRNGWNGCYKGLKQPTGNYIYVIKAFDKQGKERVKKGTILLLN